MKTPIRLGRMLDKVVVGITIDRNEDIHEWHIEDYPTIVVWENETILSVDGIIFLFHFWLRHGARTFHFGGRYGYRTEEVALAEIKRMEDAGKFTDLVLTSNTRAFADAIWRGGFTGYVDTPKSEEPLVCVMLFGSVHRLNETRDLIRKIQDGWIPKQTEAP